MACVFAVARARLFDGLGFWRLVLPPGKVPFWAGGKNHDRKTPAGIGYQGIPCFVLLLK